ncbi:MAG: hypothetical protein NTU77_06720 [Actinobacteria bacterium]|nr:hypothetical protein [Actinomycetota bacterium]
MTVLAIIIGAAIGAPLRYSVDRWVHHRTAGLTIGSGRWGMVPWGLFAVNVAGSAIAGLVLVTTSGVGMPILCIAAFMAVWNLLSATGR